MSKKANNSPLIVLPGTRQDPPKIERSPAELAELDRAAHLPDKAFMLPSYAQDHLKPIDREMSQNEAADAIRMLAAEITCDSDFIRVLRDADPVLREQVYNEIRAHVGYPDPRPFALMCFDAD